MIDFTSGSFRMKFTGTAGNPAVTRTIVASFRRDTPLDYLWYSVYETLDPNTYDNPANYQDCAAFLRDGRPSKCLNINWITGDVVNGPMYTQDQYRICGAPVFGRAGSEDTIETAAPTNRPLRALGLLQQRRPQRPPDRERALHHAAARQHEPAHPRPDRRQGLHGHHHDRAQRQHGHRRPQRRRPRARSTSSTFPIIYVTNSTCSATYSPYNVTYPTTGRLRQRLRQGQLHDAAHDRRGQRHHRQRRRHHDLAGAAVLGLVANNFIRIMHGVTKRTGGDLRQLRQRLDQQRQPDAR